MGKAARLNAKAKMEAGILPLRVGGRTGDGLQRLTSKQRKRLAKKPFTLPVPKGSKPLSAHELFAVFEQSRQVQKEVDEGTRAPGVVDLNEEAENLAPAEAAVLDLLVSVVTRTPGRQRFTKLEPKTE